MKFKLFTGEEIKGLDPITIRQNVGYYNQMLKYYCLQVDKENMIKAIKSIKFNGIKQTPVNKDEDYLELIFDYTDIVETENDTYLMLQFDEQEEQQIHLLLRLEKDELIEKVQFDLFEAVVGR